MVVIGRLYDGAYVNGRGCVAIENGECVAVGRCVMFVRRWRAVAKSNCSGCC